MLKWLINQKKLKLNRIIKKIEILKMRKIAYCNKITRNKLTRNKISSSRSNQLLTVKLK